MASKSKAKAARTKTRDAAMPPEKAGSDGTTGAMGASGRELLYAGLGLAAFLIVLVAASGASFMVVRDFWLDETITWLLATDPSLSHMIEALRHSADSNPPGLYFLLRAMHAIGIPLNEISMRLFSASAAIAALLGIYACLRFVFDRVASMAAVLALYGGTLLMVQTFEARFYAPWLAICAWFCYCLAVMRLREKKLPAKIALAALTALMLSIHYFGVFSFIAIVAADFAADARPLWPRIKERWPLLVALPMAGVLVWFYLPQRRALTAATWVTPPTPAIVRGFLNQTLALPPVLVVAVLAGAAWCFQPRRKHGTPKPARLAPIAGLAGLAMVPVIVVAFSYTVQPATIDRYAIPGLAGAAVLLAWLYAHLPRSLAIATAAAIAIYSGVRFRSNAGDWEGRNLMLYNFADILEKFPEGELIVFEQRHEYYPIALYHPELARRFYMLDFETSEETAETVYPTPDYCIVERDANRAVVRNYPQMQLFPRKKLAAGQTFLLVTSNNNLERLGKRFRGAQFRPVMQYGEGMPSILEVTLPR